MPLPAAGLELSARFCFSVPLFSQPILFRFSEYPFLIFGHPQMAKNNWENFATGRNILPVDVSKIVGHPMGVGLPLVLIFIPE